MLGVAADAAPLSITRRRHPAFAPRLSAAPEVPVGRHDALHNETRRAMPHVESRLAELGLTLPAPMRLPAGAQPKWRQVRVLRDRVVIAGHGPRAVDGSFAGPGGKLGLDLTVEQGQLAATLTGLAILADLKDELGDLDRVTGWVRVFGMVNSAEGSTAQAAVIDGFTDLMIQLYGEESAICPRAVAGVAELAFDSPVIIEGEAMIDAVE